MWTKEKVRELCSELQTAAIENGETFDDAMAFDIADGVLASEPGLQEFLENEMGIGDPVGYIANYIG